MVRAMQERSVHYTRDLVLRKVRQMFPASTVAEALQALDLYCDPEPARVQLAILKLCAGNLSAIHGLVESAKSDDRDVLVAAEYSRESKLGFPVSRFSEEYEAAREADRAEYLALLNGGNCPAT